MVSFRLLFAVVYGLFSGRIANTIVHLISWFLFIDWDSALRIYQYYIRNNMDDLILIFMGLSFLLFF